MAVSDDDDKTVIGKPWPAPGDAPASAFLPEADALELPVGARVAEFEILRLIGVGGFGIVYLAYDHSLGRQVALKEYLPSAMAYRTSRGHVTVKSRKQADTFASGLRSFVNEAKLLAQFNHPALVKVYRFWEANGTAYMVMPFYEGRTLKQVVQEREAPPSEDWVYRLFSPLLDALAVLHRENCLHRDIAPDNILLLADDRPVLLDFGAARQVIGDTDKTLTVILKPGYAPVEQYADTPGMRQGPWTDIYALGAVMLFTLTGKAPKASVMRLMAGEQTEPPLALALAGRYPPALLQAIDLAMAVRPEARPADVGQLRALLWPAQSTLSAPPLPTPFSAPPPPALSPPPAQPTVTTPQPQRKPHPAEPGAPARPRTGIGAAGWAGAAAAAVLSGAAALWFWPGAHGPRPAEAPVMQPSTPTTTQPTPPAVSAPPASASPPPPVAVAVVEPFHPTSALERVHALRDPQHTITLSLEQPRLRIGKDKLRFALRSDQAGYVYLLMLGSDPTQMHLLFPNELDSDNRITPDKAMRLPRPGWSMTAGGPPGTDQLVAVVSRSRRSFSDLGLRKDGPFAAFSLPALAAAHQAQPERAVLAGTPTCAGQPDCAAAYGAVRFFVEEIE